MIHILNLWGERAWSMAGSMLWQSTLLILVVLGLDLALKRKLRAAVRYALWLVVLLKLVLPPSMALPTGPAWWLRPNSAPQPQSAAKVVVRFGPGIAPSTAPLLVSDALPQPARPQLSLAGGALAVWGAVALGMLAWMVMRWQRLAQTIRSAAPAPESVCRTIEETRKSLGCRQRVRLRLVKEAVSPALCGLLKPVILLPRALVTELLPEQLQSVLVHEFVHLRRGDVWVNCFQALVQIFYWWHPLVWLANNRIRRVREEAVDQAVMVVLRDQSEVYIPTLLQVARLALERPVASLALVGILESQNSLRERIERLLDFRAPRRARLGVGSLLFVVAFAAVAVPMGKSAGPKVAESISPEDLTNNPAQGVSGVTITELVQSAKLLYEMGKLDEAEAKLTQALRQDPNNQGAYYYLNLIGETRFKRGESPRTNVSGSPRGRIALYSQLDKIRLPQFGCEHLPVAEVLNHLREQVRVIAPQNHLSFMVSPGPIGTIKVTIHPPLRDIRVADALDAVVKTAERPIQYSVEDYGIVFSIRQPVDTNALYTRVIRVDPARFLSSIASGLGIQEPDPRNAGERMRLFFEALGLDMSPPKSVWFKDREGVLLVRGTLQDLDTIEQAIAALNLPSPQINLKASFIELPEAQAEAFWSQHPARNGYVLHLSESEARDQLARWRSDPEAQFLANSSVTTLSGRETEIQVVQLKDIGIYTNAPYPHWETNAVPLGPILDVLPMVNADGLSLQLTLTGSATEFLGYDTPGAGGLPLPHFRLRKLATTVRESVWDGQTLVLGAPINEQGRPAEAPGDGNKRLLLLITPTLIDQVGNRYPHPPGAIPETSHPGTNTAGLWYPSIPPRPAR